MRSWCMVAAGVAVGLACGKTEMSESERVCNAYCDDSVGCAAELGLIGPESIDEELAYCRMSCGDSTSGATECARAELAMFDCLSRVDDCERFLGAPVCTAEIDAMNAACDGGAPDDDTGGGGISASASTSGGGGECETTSHETVDPIIDESVPFIVIRKAGTDTCTYVHLEPGEPPRPEIDAQVTAPWRVHYAVISDTAAACSYDGSPGMFGGMAAATADGTITLDFGGAQDLPCGADIDLQLTFDPMFEWVPETDEIVADAIAVRRLGG